MKIVPLKKIISYQMKPYGTFSFLINSIPFVNAKRYANA